MPDLCTAPVITLIISDQRDWRDTRLWLGTRTGAGGTATLTESCCCFFLMAQWTTGYLDVVCFSCWHVSWYSISFSGWPILFNTITGGLYDNVFVSSQGSMETCIWCDCIFSEWVVVLWSDEENLWRAILTSRILTLLQWRIILCALGNLNQIDRWRQTYNLCHMKLQFHIPREKLNLDRDSKLK